MKQNNLSVKRILLSSGILITIFISIWYFRSDFFTNQLIESSQENISDRFLKGGEISVKLPALDKVWNDGVKTLILMPLEYSEENCNRIDSIFSSDPDKYNSNNTLAIAYDTLNYTPTFRKFNIGIVVQDGKPLDFIIKKESNQFLISSIRKEGDTYLLRLK